MPTQTPPLNPAAAYMFCTVCRQNGNPSVPLQRDGHILRCEFGHQPSSQQLYGADMVKASDIFLETPAITDIMWKIPINPRVKAVLEDKLKGRILVTIGTLLAALADDTLVMITGEQAAELRALGVKNGADMLSAVKTAKETERSLADAVTQLERFQAMLNAASAPS